MPRTYNKNTYILTLIVFSSFGDTSFIHDRKIIVADKLRCYLPKSSGAATQQIATPLTATTEDELRWVDFVFVL